MFEIQFFPLVGLVIGADYINSDIDESVEYLDKKHSITLYVFLVGVTFSWYTAYD